MRLLLLTSLLALLEWEQVRGENYCFKTDPKRPQTLEFSSKSVYNRVSGHDAEKFNVPGCKATKMWIYHRHGTRLMEKDDIEKSKRLGELRDLIKGNYDKMQISPDTNTLCDADLNELQKWRWNSSITVDLDEHLTEQGYEDLRNSAKRYQSYYPELLPKTYNSTYFRFGHTDTQRTYESFKAFADGLFDNSTGVSAEISNELLLAYNNCQDYYKTNYMGDGSEFKKFITGAIYNNTIANITKRLRLSKLYKEDIDMMYKMCRFELAWKPKESSVWCAVFRPEEVTVLNYAEELKNYYGSGYGFNASDKLNCLVVQDLLTVLNSTESPNVVAYFAHSPGLQMLLVSLGIAKDDEKLRADNFENMANRKWKLSELVPFGANFVAVKYNCSEAADNVTEKALFFLNEKPVEFKWCKNGLCNWSDVLKTYHIFSDANCKEFYCKKEKPKQTKEEHNSIENEINGVVQNVSEVAGSFVKGAENAADTFVKGAENAADTFAKGAENTFKTIKNIVNAGETIAPLMVTTLLTVIVRQLVL